MTIKEKAEKTGLPIEQVAEIATLLGINAEDVERKLESVEGMKLGAEINKMNKKQPTKQEPEKEAPAKPAEKSGEIRFWTRAIRQIIQAGEERVEFKEHALVLDAEEDRKKIGLIRRLKNIVGRYEIYEVLDTPWDEDSNEFYNFQRMLEGIALTGQNGEKSKAGIKTIRALFSHEELVNMGEHGFTPQRLIQKALRNKSLKAISN